MRGTAIVRLLGILGLTLLLSSLALASSVALAEDATASLTPTSGPAGTKVTVVGTDATGLATLASYGLSVVIQYDGKEVVNQKVAAGTTRGEWSFEATGAPGAHTVAIGYINPTNGQFTASSTLTFTITAAATQPAAQPAAQPAQLPSSGDNLPAAVLVGVGFGALSLGLVIRRLAPTWSGRQ
jgi:hypothetical protein